MEIVQDLTGLGKLANSKMVNKVYDDALSQPMKETGEFLTHAAKALRLFFAPIQLFAAFQDRLTAFCEKVRQRVPEDRQVEAAPSIAIPVLLSLRCMEDDNPLTELFLNLLTRAIDRERLGEAHPAFVRIIEQLSPDEAVLLYLLRDHDLRIDYDKEPRSEPTYRLQLLSSVEYLPFPRERLVYSQNLSMYLSHLLSLNLLTKYTGPVATLVLGPIEYRVFRTNEFGNLFVRACVPDRLPTKTNGMA